MLNTLSQVAQREKERQEAIARGEPDPELKRKRYFLVSPPPLNQQQYQEKTSKAGRWGQQWGGNERGKEEEKEGGKGGKEAAEEKGEKRWYRGLRRGEAEEEEGKTEEDLDRGRVEGEGGNKKREISDNQRETESQAWQEEGISDKVWTKVWLTWLY